LIRPAVSTAGLSHSRVSHARVRCCLSTCRASKLHRRYWLSTPPRRAPVAAAGQLRRRASQGRAPPPCACRCCCWPAPPPCACCRWPAHRRASEGRAPPPSFAAARLPLPWLASTPPRVPRPRFTAPYLQGRAPPPRSPDLAQKDLRPSGFIRGKLESTMEVTP
jgi:hypothetical protein